MPWLQAKRQVVKVVFLLTQDSGGPVDLTVTLAGELAGRPSGPDVTVVGPAPASREGAPWNLQRTAHVQSKRDLRGLAEVARLLEELAPDLIHAQDRRAGLVASLVAGTKTPVVMTFHGVPDSAAGRWVNAGPLHGRRSGLSGGSRLVADALVARRVRCTAAPSRAIAQFLQRELRVPARRVRVLHNGVSIPSRREHRYGVRTFATASSFAPCKATPVLVEAFLAVAAERPVLRLRMIGDGPERRRCEQLARRADRERQVECTGFRTDVYAELAQSDVFVLPSLNENLPLALLQAMATGLPCIASDVGGVSEVVTSDCGVLVAPGNSESLRAAMERLIDEPGLAERLGAAARHRVVERFSLAQCADDHMRLWSDILGNWRR
jgi:glycosyltransferase involved in cell wall biosynthesis